MRSRCQTPPRARRATDLAAGGSLLATCPVNLGFILCQVTGRAAQEVHQQGHESMNSATCGKDARLEIVNAQHSLRLDTNTGGQVLAVRPKAPATQHQANADARKVALHSKDPADAAAVFKSDVLRKHVRQHVEEITFVHEHPLQVSGYQSAANQKCHPTPCARWEVLSEPLTDGVNWPFAQQDDLGPTRALLVIGMQKLLQELLHKRTAITNGSAEDDNVPAVTPPLDG
mmetsp:Transcript_20602/g.54960  ORF Transcript_20602/g.54960 Transcript_20602/m.54960 type:complete len:230 (+) Transcript_20602:1805-2494(+)